MRRMRRVSVVVVLLVVTMLAVVAAPGAAAPQLKALDPRDKTDLREEVPINIVFVGYERNEVSPRAFLSALPKTYDPVARIPFFYGDRKGIGIHYTYDYEITFTPKSYEDRAFSALARLGKSAPLTTYQTNYNNQANNVVDIDSNIEIPAASAERWLAEHPPAGVDTSEDTLYLLDWYGRKDFKFHVYSHTVEPKPDTGFNYGIGAVRRFIAWGGTPPDDPETGWGKVRRVWFYDLSAGPEYWTRNWYVDGPDSDADGVSEQRNPPVWEYTRGGYRAPTLLTSDLARVARFVAIDLLFTPSPLYPAAITPPKLPTDIAVDMNFFDVSEADLKAKYIRPKVITKSLEGLTPYRSFTADVQRQSSADDPQHALCYGAWLAAVGVGPSCYPTSSYSDYDNMFLYAASSRDLYFDDRKAHYEAGSYNYITPSSGGGTCLAYADGNPRSGVQSFIYSFLTPTCLDSIGFTDLLVHEYGHHMGMSHQHDGYDSELGAHFSAINEKWLFAYVGTENNSVMSYTHVNNEFSQFDRDNIDRWLTAAYLDAARTLVGRMIGKAASSGYIRLADELAADADAAFAAHKYRTAVDLAREAYASLVIGAQKVGVKIVGDDSARSVEDGGEQEHLAPHLERAYTDYLTKDGDYQTR